MKSLLIAVGLLLSFSSAGGAQEPADRWQRSYNAEARGDYGAALREQLEVRGPTRDDYLFHLRHGWLLYLNARPVDALAPYRRAIELAPRSVEARLGLMLPLMALRRWRDVVSVAHEIRRIDPQNVTAHRRLAYALFSLGRFEQAQRVYEQVLERWPGDLEMKEGVGWCQLRLGRTREAADSFGEVLAVSPNDTSALEGARLAAGAAH